MISNDEMFYLSTLSHHFKVHKDKQAAHCVKFSNLQIKVLPDVFRDDQNHLSHMEFGEKNSMIRED